MLFAADSCLRGIDFGRRDLDYGIMVTLRDFRFG